MTVTHARLRAQQGDAQGAAAILRELLARQPGDREASALLASLTGSATEHTEPEEPSVHPPTAASARELAQGFRRKLARPHPARGRLERFLAVVTRRAR